MSEILTEDISRGTRFERLHLLLPAQDYKTYFQEVSLQWQENLEDAWENEEPEPRAMWLRRNADGAVPDSAHIDYFVTDNGEPVCLAAIDINSLNGEKTVELWKGSDGDEVLLCEPYSTEALERAVVLAEQTFTPTQN